MELNGGASVRKKKKETKRRSGFFLATADENDDLQQFGYLLFLKETVHCLRDVSGVDGVVIRVVAVIAFFN